MSTFRPAIGALFYRVVDRRVLEVSSIAAPLVVLTNEVRGKQVRVEDLDITTLDSLSDESKYRQVMPSPYTQRSIFDEEEGTDNR